MNKPPNSPLISHASVESKTGLKATVAAISLAVIIGIGYTATGVLRGYNNKPRADHEKGIALTNKKANKKVMCLRELFHDKLNPKFFKNLWRARNCDEKKLERLSASSKPFRNIVEERKDIFIEEEINPATETWIKDGDKMIIEIDERSRIAGINTGKIKK